MRKAKVEQKIYIYLTLRGLARWDKKEKADGNGEVSTHSIPTQCNPTFSRTTLGAAISDANLRGLFGYPKKRQFSLMKFMTLGWR